MGPEQTAVVEIFTLAGCGHCVRARDLLNRRGIRFTEIRGDGNPRFRHELHERTGRLTVPQIAVDGTAVGGASDLVRLDRRGILEPLMRRKPFPRAVVSRRFSIGGLASAITGGGCDPWRYAVEIVDRDGVVTERLPLPEPLAREFAVAFNAGDRTEAGR